jgi:hypothetical protein
MWSSFSSYDNDSIMIVSCWCIGVTATYHISNTDASSDLEPDEGDLERGVRLHPKENLPFESRAYQRAISCFLLLVQPYLNIAKTKKSYQLINISSIVL